MESNDKSNTQIFVARLHPRVSEKELKSKFRKYGEIVDVRLKKGYAFIDYEDAKGAKEAVDRMDGKDFEGQAIVVQASKQTKRERRNSNDLEREPRKRGPGAEDTCFNCNKSGHWYNECREPKKLRPRREIDDVKCYKCGGKGHKQRFCKETRGRSHSSGDRRRRRRRSYSSRSSSSESSRPRSRSRDRERDRRHRRSRSSSSSSSQSRRNYRKRSEPSK